MKKNEIIKAINAYSAILLRLKKMKNTAMDTKGMFFIPSDKSHNETLINYLDAEITDVKKEFLDFVSQNITTLEQ
jgi:hypothetical protein